MPRYGLAYASMTWSLAAFLFEALRLIGVPLIVVRYEDLILDPMRELRRVLDFVGADVPDGEFAHAHQGVVNLDVSHTVAGNPMRFATGDIVLKPDDEWREGLTAREQRLVLRLTAVARRRYGYR
jgi:hypothetical protein